MCDNKYWIFKHATFVICVLQSAPVTRAFLNSFENHNYVCIYFLNDNKDLFIVLS